MPKYIPRKGNPFVIFVFFGLVATYCYFYPLAALIFLSIFVLICIWSYFDQPKIDDHFIQITKGREAVSICDFSREFNCNDVDTWIIRAVYEQVQNYIPYKETIAIRSTDKLEEDLYIDNEDLDLDLVEEIAQRTGRILENCENNPYYGNVKTVRDLVLFFNCQPKKEAG